MPHVDTSLRVRAAAPRACLQRPFADPALWAWLVVGLMLIIPLRAFLAA